MQPRFSHSAFLSEVLQIFPVTHLANGSSGIGHSSCRTFDFYINEEVERLIKDSNNHETLITARIGRPAAALAQGPHANSIPTDPSDPEGKRLLDAWPACLQVHVNRHKVNLDPDEPSQVDFMISSPPSPHALDITSFIQLPTRRLRIRRNNIRLNWHLPWHMPISDYFVSIYLMKRVTVDTLAKQLLASRVLPRLEVQDTILKRLGVKKEPTRSSIGLSQFVRENGRKEEADEEEDCVAITPDLSVSLLCPLLRSRMRLPVRTAACTHLQCFCLYNFLSLNKSRRTWKCPLCKLPSAYENLFVDSLQQSILSEERSRDCETIYFHPDGTWSTEKEAKQSRKSRASTSHGVVEVLDLSLTASSVKVESSVCEGGGPVMNEDEEEEVVIDLISDSETEGDNSPAGVSSNKPPQLPQPPPSKKPRKDLLVSSKSWSERRCQALGISSSFENDPFSLEPPRHFAGSSYSSNFFLQNLMPNHEIPLSTHEILAQFAPSLPRLPCMPLPPSPPTTPTPPEEVTIDLTGAPEPQTRAPRFNITRLPSIFTRQVSGLSSADGELDPATSPSTVSSSDEEWIVLNQHKSNHPPRPPIQDDEVIVIDSDSDSEANEEQPVIGVALSPEDQLINILGSAHSPAPTPSLTPQNSPAISSSSSSSSEILSNTSSSTVFSVANSAEETSDTLSFDSTSM